MAASPCIVILSAYTKGIADSDISCWKSHRFHRVALKWPMNERNTQLWRGMMNSGIIRTWLTSSQYHLIARTYAGNATVRNIYKLQGTIAGRDSSVGIATRYGLDGPGIESRWVARFSEPVQTGPGAHPASCTMGTGSFPEGKAVGAWCWSPIFSAEVLNRVQLYLYPP